MERNVDNLLGSAEFNDLIQKVLREKTAGKFVPLPPGKKMAKSSKHARATARITSQKHPARIVSVLT